MNVKDTAIFFGKILVVVILFLLSIVVYLGCVELVNYLLYLMGVRIGKEPLYVFSSICVFITVGWAAMYPKDWN